MPSRNVGSGACGVGASEGGGERVGASSSTVLNSSLVHGDWFPSTVHCACCVQHLLDGARLFVPRRGAIDVLYRHVRSIAHQGATLLCSEGSYNCGSSIDDGTTATDAATSVHQKRRKNVAKTSQKRRKNVAKTSQKRRKDGSKTSQICRKDSAKTAHNTSQRCRKDVTKMSQ